MVQPSNGPKVASVALALALSQRKWGEAPRQALSFADLMMHLQRVAQREEAVAEKVDYEVPPFPLHR